MNTIFSILGTLLILSLVIAIHEYGHFIVARLLGIGVSDFSIGFGKKLFTKKIRRTFWHISAIPLGGYVKLVGENENSIEDKEWLNSEYYCVANPYKRFAVAIAGVLFNVFSAVIFGVIYLMSFGISYFEPHISEVNIEGQAYIAGIKSDSIIKSVNGKDVTDVDKAIEYIKNIDRKQEYINISVLKDGIEKKYNVKTSFRKSTLKEMVLYKKEYVNYIDITFFSNNIIHQDISFKESFIYCLDVIKMITNATFNALSLVLSGTISVNETFSSPIGVAQNIDSYKDFGWSKMFHIYFTTFFSISIAVAIMNILPFPPLDGGLLISYIFEMIGMKKIGLLYVEFIGKIFTPILVCFGIYLMIKDLYKWII